MIINQNKHILMFGTALVHEGPFVLNCVKSLNHFLQITSGIKQSVF